MAASFFPRGRGMGCQVCQICQTAPRGLFWCRLSTKTRQSRTSTGLASVSRTRHGNKSLREGQDDGLSGLSGLSDGAWAGIWASVAAKSGQTCDLTKLTKLTVPSLAPASRVELRTCPEWGQATFFSAAGNGLSVLSGLSVGSSGSFWCSLSTKTRQTCKLTNLTNLTSASRTPTRQYES